MKLITGTLLSALSCYTDLAAAATGRVITLDPSLSSHEHSTTQQDTLSPEIARLVIAQRAGLEDYHVGKALNDEEINAINAHGLQTSRLSKDNNERVLILAFVDEEDAEAFGTLRHVFARRGPCEQQHKVRMFRAARPDLLPVDHVVIAVANGSRLER